MLVGVSTAKIVSFHKDSTELRMRGNCVFFLPATIEKLTKYRSGSKTRHDYSSYNWNFCTTNMSLDSSRLWDFAHQVSAFSASLFGGSSPAKSFLIHTYNPEKYRFTDTHSLQITFAPINSFISSRCRRTHLLSKYPQFI